MSYNRNSDEVTGKKLVVYEQSTGRNDMTRRKVRDIEHGEFSKLFFEALDEIYQEWTEAEGKRLPDFEEAIERAKTEGVSKISPE
jgi:hypothetical protein